MAARPAVLPRLGRPSKSPVENDPNMESPLETSPPMSQSNSAMSPTHDMGHILTMPNRQEYSMWRGPGEPGDYQAMTPRPTHSASSSLSSLPSAHRILPQHSHISHHQRILSAPQNYLPSLPSLSAAPFKSSVLHTSDISGSNGTHTLNGNYVNQHWQSQYYQPIAPIRKK